MAATVSTKRCSCEQKDWVDEYGYHNGTWIRTKCGRCGRFIGYRPQHVDNKKAQGKHEAMDT